MAVGGQRHAPTALPPGNDPVKGNGEIKFDVILTVHRR